MAKKYRSVFIFTAFLLFNLLESLYFGQGTPRGYNLYPINIWEWLCDIFSVAGMFFAGVMALYDTREKAS